MILLSAVAVAIAVPSSAAARPADPLVADGEAVAEGSEAAPGPTPGDAKKAHIDEDETIVITGVGQSAWDVLGNVTVLDREELAHDLKPSLGDTLADMPGVSSSSFGPTASRPILRGLSGERAGVLVDGIGALDLSASDPDHAVTINPLTAERIEILRGPGALPYNSSTIGGVVNVIDGRIPRRMPDDWFDANVMLDYGSAANERSANAGLDFALGAHLVAHVDGAYSKYDDLHVGDYLLSEPLRRRALASPDADIRALAALKDKLLNTAGRIDDVAGGVAYVDGELNVGISYNHHDARYGVPIRFSLDPAIEPEEPTIDAHQDRGGIRANVPIGGFFNLFELRGGISNYRHAEIEADGVIGSRFHSRGGELRADLVQVDRSGWSGATGVDYVNQDARIRGDEKYLPDSHKQNIGLFTLQTLIAGRVRLEGGLRVEFARLTAKPDEGIAETAEEQAIDSGVGEDALTRRFTSLSGSVGGNLDLGGGWRAGLSLSHSERVPSIDELFSLGPHGGSQQFLIGEPDLTKEKSNSGELNLNRITGRVHLQANVYYSRYSNFIFQVPTGAIQDRLPIYEYRQGRATYYGFEVEADAKFGQAMGIEWGGELVADAVRAKIKNFGNAPEIPPFRVLAGLTGKRGQFEGRIEVERVSSQHKIAPVETPTPGYTMVSASFDWHPSKANPDLTLALTANNLFDVNARRHSSDLKDYAPLTGRDVRLNVRLGF